MEKLRVMQWAEWIEILENNSHYEVLKGQQYQAVIIDKDFLRFKLLHSKEWIPMEKEGKLFKYIDEPIAPIGMKKEYDYINPDHYKNGGKEVIQMMEDIWGAKALIAHCEMTAFKYRMRAGKKPDQPIERDLEKAEWYEAKAEELRMKSIF